jgi:hypothetical protein
MTEEKELFLWSVVFDNQGPTEVIAADEWDALNMTEPERDANGRRTWRKAWASNITPIAPDYCTID